jgi:hypothetical protein
MLLQDVAPAKTTFPELSRVFPQLMILDARSFSVLLKGSSCSFDRMDGFYPAVRVYCMANRMGRL